MYPTVYMTETSFFATVFVRKIYRLLATQSSSTCSEFKVYWELFSCLSNIGLFWNIIIMHTTPPPSLLPHQIEHLQAPSVTLDDIDCIPYEHGEKASIDSSFNDDPQPDQTVASIANPPQVDTSHGTAINNQNDTIPNSSSDPFVSTISPNDNIDYSNVSHNDQFSNELEPPIKKRKMDLKYEMDKSLQTGSVVGISDLKQNELDDNDKQKGSDKEQNKKIAITENENDLFGIRTIDEDKDNKSDANIHCKNQNKNDVENKIKKNEIKDYCESWVRIGQSANYEECKLTFKHVELLSMANRHCPAAQDKSLTCDGTQCGYKYHLASDIPCIKKGCNGSGCNRNHTNTHHIQQYKKIDRLIKRYDALKATK